MGYFTKSNKTTINPPSDGIDEVYGAHLWNCALSGTIGCAAGSVTANSDSLDITVTGTGGHASAPQVPHLPTTLENLMHG